MVDVCVVVHESRMHRGRRYFDVETRTRGIVRWFFADDEIGRAEALVQRQRDAI